MKRKAISKTLLVEAEIGALDQRELDRLVSDYARCYVRRLHPGNWWPLAVAALFVLGTLGAFTSYDDQFTAWFWHQAIHLLAVLVTIL